MTEHDAEPTPNLDEMVRLTGRYGSLSLRDMMLRCEAAEDRWAALRKWVEFVRQVDHDAALDETMDGGEALGLVLERMDELEVDGGEG